MILMSMNVKKNDSWHWISSQKYIQLSANVERYPVFSLIIYIAQ